MFITPIKNHLFYLFVMGHFTAVSCVYANPPINTVLDPIEDEYVFDQALFRGQSEHGAALLEHLSRKESILPDLYKVDTYVNNQFIQRMVLDFKERTAEKIEPCFTSEMLQKLGIAEQTLAKINAETQICVFLSSHIQGSLIQFDFNRLRLDISLPQSEMINRPRGYVNPSAWDAGGFIGFMNYAGNYYHTSYNDSHYGKDQSAAYVSLNGGVNIGKWQYRQQSSLNDSAENGTSWTNIRRYLSRPLEPIQGVLTLGQSYSSGKFFSGLSFNGISVFSDERMLPESMRGYAPTVQGIAKTNAKVSIVQNGKEIYQTTVAPGPFKIKDLYPTNFNGDLTVNVQEADGTVSQFNVPFSAVPESIRAGTSRYYFDLGQTRDIGEDTFFSNMTYQRGISNAITLNSGLRIAEEYQAALLGATYAAGFGALGTNVTFSRADLPTEKGLTGWMANLTYSKTFQPTQTTISLAGYRYSTEGYRDLADVIGVREAFHQGETWESSSDQQRSRIELTLNQSVNDYGMFFVSGAIQNYRDGRDDDIQAQIGYGKAFSNGLNLNISFVRQRYGDVNLFTDELGANNTSMTDHKDMANRNSMVSDYATSMSASISFPLGGRTKAGAPHLDLAYSHSDHSSDLYQGTVSGSLNTDQSLNYALGMSHDQNMDTSLWTANLNQRLAHSSLGLNTSYGEDYWQAAANIQGAFAVHSGGITFGPYLGETFALIEAKGAEGARIFNGQGTKINRQGYALLPSMTPYRYNSISLDPAGISDRVEIVSNDQRVAPYAGAAVKVNFKTRIGYQILIQAKLDTGEPVPLGAEVLDEYHNVIGMVGQNGQMYVRAASQFGKLYVQWGDNNTQQCEVSYFMDDEILQQQMIRFEKVCTSGELQ